MGFEKDVSQILTSIKHQKGNHHTSAVSGESEQQLYQSVLLSATLSTDVKRLASVALVDPVTVDVAVNMDTLSNEVQQFWCYFLLYGYFIKLPR